MIRFGLVIFSTGLMFAGALMSRAEGTNAPDFQQVYNLIREHAGGLSEADLNRAAVKGLVSQLGPRVSLVTNDGAASGGEVSNLITKASVYEGPIGYLRVARVDEGLPRAIESATGKLLSTNKLMGLVLDLRYAAGDDYQSAAMAADLFVSKRRPLIKLGENVVESKAKETALRLPLAVLVNQETARAAEALAAMTRETGSGLLLGNKTAGQAMEAQEYPLNDGARLRIATTPIELGDGTKLNHEGVQPDIKVEVKPEDERAYYADAFKIINRPTVAAAGNLTGTNQVAGTNRGPRRPRYNEAELVRERREGINLDADSEPIRREEPEQPVVRDPALARALDLLKGLAVVRQSRS